MNEQVQIQDRHQAHLQLLIRGITRAITGMPPGQRRLLVAVEAYWEGRYRLRTERAVIDAAAQRLALDAELGRRSVIFERMVAAELGACGVPHPSPIARSLCREVQDIAQAELFAGHRMPWQRRRLIGFIESRLAPEREPLPATAAG